MSIRPRAEAPIHEMHVCRVWLLLEKERRKRGTLEKKSSRRHGNSYAAAKNYRFFVKRFPVLRNPRSPIALLHSIDSWPKTVLPSRFMSFCRPSSPSCSPFSCSTRNATCRTSRGLSVGRFGFTESGLAKFQFRVWDWNGGLGFNVVPCVNGLIYIYRRRLSSLPRS